MDENPHGKLTQFNIWTRELSTMEMINFTLSCQNLVDITGKYKISTKLWLRPLCSCHCQSILGLHFDWDKLSNQSIDKTRMTVQRKSMHHICDRKDSIQVLVARGLV